jgi:hypothetical protein
LPVIICSTVLATYTENSINRSFNPPSPQSLLIDATKHYNSSLSEYKPEYSVVSYAPIVDANSSDTSTVYTTMRRCQEMTKSLGQAYSIQTWCSNGAEDGLSKS